ncbi:MAG: glycoside hydrolase [Isosphaeraceae bacterium]
MRHAPILVLSLLAIGQAALADDNRIVNGGFESGLEGWAPAWSREPSIRAVLDESDRRDGKASIRIEHQGARDWSLAQAKRLDVRPGTIFELGGWVKAKGEGRVSLSVTLYDAKGGVIDWLFGAAEARNAPDWLEIRSRFAIPEGCAQILPRLTGDGPITAWADGISLKSTGQIDLSRAGKLPASLTIRNKALEATFKPADGTFALKDLRTGQSWTQRPVSRVSVADASAQGGVISAVLFDPARASEVRIKARLDGDLPELVVELSGEGPMSRLRYPHPVESPAGSWLILPVNEGIGYPADDPKLTPMHYILYGGHGLCMAWYGVMGEQGRSLMMLVETPDDASVDLPRLDGLLHLGPEWEPQRGEFGYTRTMRYVAIDRGGYIAMAKRHRKHAEKTGLLKTLEQKRKEIPAVDRLVGAVNVWAFGQDGPSLCKEMQSLGIRRILWSAGGSGDQIARMNAMPDVLTSRYDIYQDCMDPANFPNLKGIHGDWTTAGWPDDVMRNAQGDWIRGWGVEGKQPGQMFDCGVLCDKVAPEYARKRIAEELKFKPFQCRFIDTTTASPWRECYAPAHPLTRTDSRRDKMELLDVVSREFKLVTGCETGHEASVPYLHYFEGMMSLGPYRVPDAGRNMQQILDEVPERVARFQTGSYYRLPLWELVYHDCTVSQWYWGDYNNKLPKLWDRRDLWNALYGTPPMFLFTKDGWQKNRDRFVKSYQVATPIARATGYSEMIDHAWLTDDHEVQRTRFANGVTVTVNFGEKPYTLQDGTKLPPLGHRFEGLPATN